MKHCTGSLIIAFCVALTSIAKADQPPFVMAASVLPGYAHKDGSGVANLIANEAFRRIGTPLTIEFFPSNRAKMMLNAGKVDGYLTGTKALSRKLPETIMVAEPFAKAVFVAVSKNPQTRIGGWADLRNYWVGYVLGAKIFDRFVPNEGNRVSKEHNYSDLRTFLFRKTRPGQPEKVILQDRFAAVTQFHKEINKTVFVVEPPLAEIDGHFFVHKKFAALASRLAIALREMKAEGKIDQLTDSAIALQTAAQDAK